MVNGTFPLAPNWEKSAGQTWSTRPFCRPRRPSIREEAGPRAELDRGAAIASLLSAPAGDRRWLGRDGVLLARQGVALSEAQAALIQGCADPALLTRWCERAVAGGAAPMILGDD